MPPRTQYFAISVPGATEEAACGLARRTFTPDGPVDEVLHRDSSWHLDSAIVEWECGDVGARLSQIDDAEAQALTDSLRTAWGPPRLNSGKVIPPKLPPG